MTIWLHMVYRRFWLEQIKGAWERRPIVWLAGVRRVGKTYLPQCLPDIEYFDCELPRIRRRLEDPQSFLEMTLAYRQQGKEILPGNALIEPLPAEITDIRQTA